MKFKLSGFVYGMGTGIIILSLLYYTVYNFNLSDMLTAEKLKAKSENIELTDSEIEDLARGIGMIFPEDEASYVRIDIPEGSDINDVAEILVNNRMIDGANGFYTLVIKKNIGENIQSIHNKTKKVSDFDEISEENTGSRDSIN